ncbi:MAG: outer membrane beta-barrel domain-containing protein, partial [Myxococcota bacterium]
AQRWRRDPALRASSMEGSKHMRRTQCEGVNNALRAGLAACVALASVVSGPTEAFALQGGEDPASLPVLIDKRYGGKNRHQVSVMFATSMVTKFTEGIGAYAAYQYNFSDMLGLEVGGGFFGTNETSIMEEIRATNGDEPFLSDQYGLQWTATANVVFVPIYGKMSFASEFHPSFDLFLLAGGGVVGASRKFGGTPNQPTSTTDSEITWGIDVGGGFRFYITELVALRLEFRNWFYPDPANFLSPNTMREIGGMTSVLNAQIGVQFAFGGDS